MQMQFHFYKNIKQEAKRSLNTLRKSLQTASTSPCRIYVTDFVSLIYNLKTVF